MKYVAGNKNKSTGLSCVALMLALVTLGGCKTSESSDATIASSSTDASSESPTGDASAKCNSQSFCTKKLPPPEIISLGEAPLSLALTPRLEFDSAKDEHLAKIPVEAQVVQASNDLVIFPWAEISGTRISGLQLIEGASYYINLRSFNSKGRKSSVVKSALWTARLGKGTWSPLSSVNAPSQRVFHSVVWTGSKMIVWGGGPEGGSAVNTGAIYDPAVDSWTTMATTNAPTARGNHTAVWTGTEMIVWGGPWQKNGGRYNPTTNTWATMSATHAPDGIGLHKAVWTGSRMIVWGGQIPVYGRAWSSDGGSYDPVSDTWSAISNVGAPSGRDDFMMVWTGSKVIVWGGGSGSNYVQVNTGAMYDPATDTWTAMSTVGAPSSRGSASPFAFSGNKFVVLATGLPALSGGSFDPASNSWTSVTSSNGARFYNDLSDLMFLPATGSGFTANVAIGGSSVFTWGGFGNGVTNTGGVYDSANDTWTGTSLDLAPLPSRHTKAVWTGTKVLLFGGENFINSSYTP